MSRAEKKLRELQAREELSRLKAEKKKRQQQEREEAKRKWDEAPEGQKRTVKVVGVIFAIFILIAILNLSSGGESLSNSEQDASGTETVPTTEVSTGSESSTSEAKVDEPVDNTPMEYKSALKQAGSYANTMHMSKAGLYDQLTSPYGGQFSAEAAQYAVDNVKTDWNANALAKAQSYQTEMAMSPAAIRDQLMSDYGEKFTQSEADYAIQNLNK